jgi:hypothetical protein
MTGHRGAPALDLTTCDRLAKLVRLLSSDRDGEVLAAVTAMKRVLRTSGLDIHAVADRMTNGGANGQDEYQRGYQVGLQHGFNAGHAKGMATQNQFTGGDELQQAAQFCAARAAYLNERERGFVVSMERLTKRRIKLTPKQEVWLLDIRDRLRRTHDR